MLRLLFVFGSRRGFKCGSGGKGKYRHAHTYTITRRCGCGRSITCSTVDTLDTRFWCSCFICKSVLERYGCVSDRNEVFKKDGGRKEGREDAKIEQNERSVPHPTLGSSFALRNLHDMPGLKPRTLLLTS